MRRPLSVLGAVLSAVLSGAPQAQVIERSTEVTAVPDGAGGFNAFFGATFTQEQSGATFADLFTFAVAGTPFDASASVTSSFLDSPGSKDLLMTGLSLYRYDPQTLAVIGNALAGGRPDGLAGAGRAGLCADAGGPAGRRAGLAPRLAAGRPANEKPPGEGGVRLTGLVRLRARAGTGGSARCGRRRAGLPTAGWRRARSIPGTRRGRRAS